MAGHRRRGNRQPGQPLPPTTTSMRPTRIRESMTARYADATTEAARLAVSKDYVLAAAASARHLDPVEVDRILAEVRTELQRAGDRLLGMHGRAARKAVG